MVDKKIKKWEPDDFELEMTSVWSFPNRGNWATHDAKWRGNWSPYIPRNVLLRYSKEGDMVLDQFAGGGTTLVEAKLLNRNIIGIDVNDDALNRCREKVNFNHPEATNKGVNPDSKHLEAANKDVKTNSTYPTLTGKVYICKGDARDLSDIPDEKIDLICTHPPYANIIHYSEGKDIPEDLSNF